MKQYFQFSLVELLLLKMMAEVVKQVTHFRTIKVFQIKSNKQVVGYSVLKSYKHLNYFLLLWNALPLSSIQLWKKMGAMMSDNTGTNITHIEVYHEHFHEF